MDPILVALIVALLVAAAASIAAAFLYRGQQAQWRAGQSSREAEFNLLVEQKEQAMLEWRRCQAQLVGEQERLRQLQEQRVVIESRLAVAQRQQERLQQVEAELQRVATERNGWQARASEHAARLEENRAAEQDKLRWIEQAREQLAQQFQALASAVLEDKSERLGSNSQQQMSTLLSPLREQLQQFQQLLVESRTAEAEGRAQLGGEISRLHVLGRQLSDDTAQLSRALTGDMRSQGAWGELVLARLLESAGLSEGREYETQVALRDGTEELRRPDVIVRLPGGRDVAIDAKVSLTAYERFCNATQQADRDRALADHLKSIRQHVTDLASRGYARSSGIAGNGIVLMFVPVEAAYLEALRQDPRLYDFALRSDVVIVSPGMLLGVLRTIEHVWRSEARSRNAEEIAERAGLLYDKFVSFVGDLQKVAEQIGKARDGVDEAIGKLARGRGNLVSQVEKLRRLGARTQKDLFAQVGTDLVADDADSE